MVSKLWFLNFIFFLFLNQLSCQQLPTIDLNSVGGKLGFIGEYAGLSEYKENRQFETIQNDSLLYSTKDKNNVLIFKLFANINGSIESYCKLSDNLFILVGDFISIDSIPFNHIAQFNTETRQFTPLQQGLDGPVKSIYCPNSTTFYIGGLFNSPINSNTSQYSGHVALYQNDQWYPLPWKGFNGPVYSIIPNHFYQSIYFAGQFNSTGNGQYFNQNISNPIIDLSTSASVSGGNSALSGQYSDPLNVLCSDLPWLLQDGLPGYWEAKFTYPIQPSLFRLSNTLIQDKSTKTFNIISLVSNQYFVLSYVDPETNQVLTCSESCPLSNNTSILYQDFTVLNEITTSGIRINIDSWYGTAGGLGSVNIFRLDSTLHPQIPSTSNSTCPSSNTFSTTSSTTSSTLLTGNWVQQYSYEAYQNYIISEIPSSDIATSNVSVSYFPHVPADGVYNVYIDTPGCVGTSSCNKRTLVTLELTFSPGQTVSSVLDQNIISDQHTLVYSGIISASTNSFKPSVVMKLSPNITSSDSVIIIASSIEFIRNSTASTLSNILHFFPNNNTWASLSQQLPTTSVVHSLQLYDEILYIGGRFDFNSTVANIVRYHPTFGIEPLTQGGLNGKVSTLLLSGSNLIVGGEFDNTLIPQENSNLNHVALYDTQTNTWSPLNQGVNNNVDFLYSVDQSTISLSGPFNQTIGNNEIQPLNNVQWNLDDKKWVIPSYFRVGSVSGEIPLSGTDTLYLGSIKNAQSYRADGLFAVGDRAFTNVAVEAAAYWKNGSETCLIAAGTFLDQPEVRLAIYSQGQWRSLLDNLEGQVRQLFVLDNVLYIGGNFTAIVNNRLTLTSFGVFQLKTQTWPSVAGIYSAQNKPGQVQVIYPKEDKKVIYIGGDFSSAGSLDCSAICMLSTNTLQWNQVSPNLAGQVQNIFIDENQKMTLVGSLTVNGGATTLATLDRSLSAWKAGPAESSLKSANSILALPEKDHYLISGQAQDGSPLLGIWDGQTFTPQTTYLDPSSRLNRILWAPMTSSTRYGRYPAKTDFMLLAVGHIVSGQVNSSAALFDGTQWHPYLLTASRDGLEPGQIKTIVTAIPCCTAANKSKRLSAPAVILISLAISLAILFFIVLLAFIYLFFKHKNHVVPAYVEPMNEWKPKYRPTSLLAMLNAANLGETSYSTALNEGPVQRRQISMDLAEQKLRNSSGLSMGVGFSFATLLADALRSSKDGPASESSPKVYYSKYPFEAKEFGELTFGAHQPLVVTDTSDNVWWMGYKDDGKGNAVSGLFPSNYVTRNPPTSI